MVGKGDCWEVYVGERGGGVNLIWQQPCENRAAVRGQAEATTFRLSLGISLDLICT